jgi:fibronectin-binding autotransporter adhesin
MLVLPRKPGLLRLPLAAAVAIFALANQANAQVITINQGFTGATLPTDWNYGGNVNNGGTITAFSPTASNSSAGMTMTTNSGNESTYAYDPTAFDSANATIAVKFTYTTSNGSAQPADGITFFLADASVVASSGFSPGAFGGSLGYAQKNAGAAPPNGTSGLNGGYLGLGIDQFGNYSNPTEGRNGGPAQLPNEVAIRGPGSGQNGYNYLGGTTNLDSGSTIFTAPAVGQPAIATNFEMTISATNQVVMYMQENGVYQQIFTADLSGYTRPNSLVLGFTGSTGGQNSTQQVANILLTSVPANLWTNIYGAANGTTNSGNWSDTAGSGNNTTSNWVHGAVPADQSPGLPADVLLDNTYVNTAQTINVGNGTNQNQVIRALSIDAPFSYTLNGGSIEFNNENNGNTVIGPSGIFVSQTHGAATQTINSNLSADNAIEIKNGSSGALNLTGTLANGGNTVTLDGNGTGLTTISGAVSGTGALVKSDSGSDTLSHANAYTGGTTLNAGTLTADNNTALGTGGVTINGGTLSSDGNNTVANTLTLQGSAKLNNITTSGVLTQTNGSYTLTMDSATQTGAVNLSNNNTARTLTVNVDSGSTSTISGVIQNGGTSAGSLTKTGTGTLTLSGADTYSGTTTINSGVLKLGASNVLATTSNVSIAGGTLNLNLNSNKVNDLTFSNGGTLDFGAGSTANSFVFNTLTAPTGVLTINNYNGPDSSIFPGAGSGDFLGTLTPTIAAATLNQIYFSGYGTGSLENAVQTAAGNGLGNAYRIAPTVINWGPYTWTENGAGSQNWSGNAGFWQGNATPPNAANPVGVFVDFGTGSTTAVNFDASSTINALRFDSRARAYNITDAGTHTLTLQNGTGLTFIQQQSANNETLSPHAMVFMGNAVFDVTGAGNLTVGSNISGAFSLTKTGSGGALILSGASTYSGGTSIQTGTLEATTNSTALGTGAVTVFNGATLQLAGGISPTNAINFSGTGTSNNGAIENVSGANTLSGALTLAGNSRINSDAGTLTLSGGVTGAGNNLNLGGAGNITVSSAITTGAGTVTVDGAGTTTFSGVANTYTGDTNVNSGTLALGKAANTTAIAGNLNINGGAVNENASGQIATGSSIALNSGSFNLGNGDTQTITQFNSSSGSTVSLGNATSILTINGNGTSTMSGLVTGAGGLATSGTGNVVLGGANTYSGGTTVASIVTPLNNQALGSGAVAINSGGKIQVQNGLTIANNFTLNSAGTGANDGAIENLSNANTFTGTVTLAGNSRIQSDNGTLVLSNTVGLGANTLNVGGNSNTTLSGVVSGTGAVTKDGTGAFTLSGTTANTYTGTTTVNAGALDLSKSANVNAIVGGLTINTGGTVNLGAAGQIATGSAVTIAGGTLNLANNSNRVGNLTFSGGGTLDFGGGTNTANSFVFNTLTASGVLTINNYHGPDSSAFPAGGFPNGANGGDYLGTTGGTIAGATLNQLYFTGYGVGATQNAASTADGFGAGTAREIAPTVINFATAGYVWTDNTAGAQNWSTNGSWSGGARPPNSAAPTNVYVDFGTGTSSTVTFDRSSTINALRFDAAAPVSYVITGNNTLTMDNGGPGGLTYVQQQSSHNQTLSPTTMTVNGNIVFDVTGTGSLTVGSNIGDNGNNYSLTKTGTGGSLILTGTNTYGGGTSITGGTVQVAGAANTTWFGTGAVAVSNGGTLDIGGVTTSNAVNFGTKQFNISGAGVGGNGVIVNSGLQQINAFENVALTGDATVGGTGNYNIGLNGGTGLDLAGNTLTKTGTNSVYVSGGTITSGNVVVNQGAFGIQHGTNVEGTGTLTYNTGTTAEFWNETGTVNRAMTFNGTNTLLNEGGATTIASNITINGSTALNFANGGTSVTLKGQLTAGAGNTGILTLNGTGTTGITLGAAQNFGGKLDLNGGTLSLAGFNATLGTLEISGNSTIDFAGGSSILNATNVIMDTGATLTINNWVDQQDYFYATNFYNGSGQLASFNAMGGTPEDQIIFTGFSSNNGMTTKWLSLDHQITPVPEPATYGAIFTGACLGLFLLTRLPRRKPVVVKVDRY